MNNQFTVEWSERSLRNSQIIVKHLSKNFSVKEVNQFYILLQSFEKTVSRFPTLYSFSKKYPDLRKAVLNKRLVVFYKIKGELIQVVSMKDTRQIEPGI